MNQLAVGDKWSQYIYSTVMNGALNPFNLVDIYKFLLGPRLSRPPTKKSIGRTSSWSTLLLLIKRKVGERTNGSTSSTKCSRKTLAQEIRIVGGAQDKKDAEAILASPALNAHRERILDHTGDFSIKDTRRLLNEANFLFVMTPWSPTWRPPPKRRPLSSQWAQLGQARRPPIKVT